MNNLILIANAIITVSEGGNWTEVDLKSTLVDVTVSEATTLTPASPNTIASLTHHLSYWNRVMIQRINGINVDVPEVNGFDVPHLSTEADWIALKNDYTASAHELAEAISGVDESRLPEPILPGCSSTYQNLQGSVEHIHYHLGQMVILKKLVRATPN